MKNKILFFLKKIKENLYKFDDVYFFIIFLICLGIHFYISLIGWSHNLLDQHGFRQTQTAISTYYTIKEGFKLHYITPVLGAPWSIPMEFPLYQWIVAFIVIIFKTSIDQTGRFVSLLFFYLSLIPLYAILKQYLKKNSYVFIILSFVLLNPTYLFWSRTFMIESLALFLGISFCWLAIKLFQTNKPIFFILASLVGSLAALVKITTFVVLCIPVVCFFVYNFFKENEKRLPSLKIIKKYAVYGIVLFVIPIIFGMTWTHFADAQKSINPLADGFITSKALTVWNFGTIQQKLDVSVWSRILEHSIIPNKIFGELTIINYKMPLFLIIFILFIVFIKPYRKEIFFSFIFFIIGPLIFTNLYYVHDYYFYANNFFLSILIGFFIFYLLEKKGIKIKIITSVLFFPFILYVLFYGYNVMYHSFQSQENKTYMKSLQAIKKYTKKNDVIYIYGFDWDPTIPYYSDRKSVMDWMAAPYKENDIQKSIEKSGKISAMIVACPKEELKTFIPKRVIKYNFNEIPVYQDELICIHLPK
jgi:hypothetical protein